MEKVDKKGKKGQSRSHVAVQDPEEALLNANYMQSGKKSEKKPTLKPKKR